MAARLPYEHGFHAGCFADVVKHSILILLLQRMREKASPFAYVETHAGAGAYDLGAALAHEASAGFARLQCYAASGAELPDPAQTLLARAEDETRSRGGDMYPGSPLLAASLCRPGVDTLTFCEKAESQFEQLSAALRGCAAASDSSLGLQLACTDGYKALAAKPGSGGLAMPHVRGLVFIDPPYQFGSDTERAAALARHLRVMWRSARLALWYPVGADRSKVDRLHEAFRDVGEVGECLAVELTRGAAAGAPPGGSGSRGSGMLLVQPPYEIESQLSELLDGLGTAMRAEGEPPAEARIEWVAR